MKVKILVVENNGIFSEGLVSTLESIEMLALIYEKKYDVQLEVLRIVRFDEPVVACASVKEASAALLALNPDLLIVDINLGGDDRTPSGIDFVNFNLRNGAVPFIYLSHHKLGSIYYQDANRTNPVHYLSKREIEKDGVFDHKALLNAIIDAVKPAISKVAEVEIYNGLLYIRNPLDRSKYNKVPIENVLYLKASKDYGLIHVKTYDDNQKPSLRVHTVKQTLTELFEVIESNFLRWVDRSHIVNILNVDFYENTSWSNRKIRYDVYVPHLDKVICTVSPAHEEAIRALLIDTGQRKRKLFTRRR